MKILVVAPNSFVVRNWTVSGLAEELTRGLNCELCMLSPFQQESFQTPTGMSVSNVGYAAKPEDPLMGREDTPKALKTLHYLRLRTFALEVPNGSIQMMRLSRIRDPLNLALKGVKMLAPKHSGQRRLARRLVSSYKPTIPAIQGDFDGIKPDVVIVGSPGHQMIDALVMIEAERRGIPVHCIVNSWDNLSSRGPLFRTPKTLLVWNEYMKTQAREIHGFPVEHTHVVGPLQFCPYEKPVSEEETAMAYQRLGLPVGTPYLLFLSGQHASEYEAEDVAELASQLDKAGVRNLKLAVRPHPQAAREPFEAISNSRVVFDQSPVFSAKDQGGEGFGLSEVRAMAALLHNAKAVVASWATTGLLEAAIFDKPAIQLRWMDKISRSKPEQAEKMRDLANYMHLQPFDACGSREFSDSPETVVKLIQQAIECPEKGAEGRKLAVERLASPPIGAAPKRIVSVLREYIC